MISNIEISFIDLYYITRISNYNLSPNHQEYHKYFNVEIKDKKIFKLEHNLIYQENDFISLPKDTEIFNNLFNRILIEYFIYKSQNSKRLEHMKMMYKNKTILIHQIHELIREMNSGINKIVNSIKIPLDRNHIRLAYRDDETGISATFRKLLSIDINVNFNELKHFEFFNEIYDFKQIAEDTPYIAI